MWSGEHRCRPKFRKPWKHEWRFLSWWKFRAHQLHTEKKALQEFLPQHWGEHAFRRSFKRCSRTGMTLEPLIVFSEDLTAVIYNKRIWWKFRGASHHPQEIRMPVDQWMKWCKIQNSPTSNNGWWSLHYRAPMRYNISVIQIYYMLPTSLARAPLKTLTATARPSTLPAWMQ
jgi:hypothetical protein